MVEHVGLYLAGAGSLDGSDPFTTVLAYREIQRRDGSPVPLARDIPQGRVINHRFAHEQDAQRNSLTESARLVRGNIDDLRDVDTEELDGAVLVGGGGVLTTWTDYHERGNDCRITERLKFHIMELCDAGKPILALDNAAVAVAVAFREQDTKPRLNPGQNRDHRSLVEATGARLSDEYPCVDREHGITSAPGFANLTNLSDIEQRIEEAFDLFEG